MRTIDVVFGVAFVVVTLCSYIHGMVVDHRLSVLQEQLRETRQTLNTHISFESSLHIHTDEVDIIDNERNLSEN